MIRDVKGRSCSCCCVLDATLSESMPHPDVEILVLSAFEVVGGCKSSLCVCVPSIICLKQNRVQLQPQIHFNRAGM